jgi:hypothetical protein
MLKFDGIRLDGEFVQFRASSSLLTYSRYVPKSFLRPIALLVYQHNLDLYFWKSRRGILVHFQEAHFFVLRGRISVVILR